MPLIDLELIVETMRKYFNTQLQPMERPMYKKPYLEQGMMPLLKGYKTPNFSSFFGEDGKSTMEHIGRFTTQTGEASHN